MSKIIAFFISIIMVICPTANFPKVDVNPDEFNTNYDYVFVHGLHGWGQYDLQNGVMPYWGMFGGSLMKYLNARGFNCHAASVAPSDSAWDRACELYAQLTGSVTDYGEEHSARCNHSRYGKDFSKKPLLKQFDEEHKINLLGHSFGGATILTFAYLMANGSEEEIAITTDGTISPFFIGGKVSWINSLTTLAAPMNGTTAYNTEKEESEGNDSLFNKIYNSFMEKASGAKDERVASDSADYDMYIDNAQKMLEKFGTENEIYYFSIPCSMTVQDENGNFVAEDGMEAIFKASANAIGKTTGQTAGGFVIDDSWKENDGLVNTISAKAPLGAPQQDLDVNNITKGVWNVYPVYHGDHMSLQGGLTHTNNVRELYVNHLTMINSI